MCGRFEQNQDNGEMQAIQTQARQALAAPAQMQYRLPLPLELAVGEIFPTNLAAVLIWGIDGPQATPMLWGFPRREGKGVIINARAESVLQKPMFRAALLERPLAVPTTGFYEWKGGAGSGKKRKFLFRESASELLYLAGMYTTFDEQDGPLRERFTILTTAANPAMRDYHDRMPVLLRESELESWLIGKAPALFLERKPFPLQAQATELPLLPLFR